MRCVTLLLLFVLSHLCGASFEDVGPSPPDEIASLSADLLIEGFISPLSGQVSLQETDLRVRAAQDLTLKRTYVPPQILGRYEDKDDYDRLLLGQSLASQGVRRWAVLSHLLAGFNAHSPYFQVRDPSGFVLEFEIREERGILKTPPYGFSNLRQGEPDSRADLRNMEFWVEKDGVRIIWPDGTERIYRKQNSSSYRLEEELLPNGKALRYHYNQQGLVKISSSDPSGRYVYAMIEKENDDNYIGSDGRRVQCHYGTFRVEGKVKQGKTKYVFSHQTPVLDQVSNPFYVHSIQYNERSHLSSYDALCYPVCFDYDRRKNFVARVERLKTPSGAITFSYDPPIAGQKEGWTRAVYENGAIVVYRFDKNLLLTAMENWQGETLVNQKTFAYNERQHLQSVATRDGVGHLLLAHHYECDLAGNPLVERIEGDFGTFSIRRIFSTKGRLLKEQREDGLGYEYTYLGGTRLLTSKTTLDHGIPIRKTLYFYDDANNLVEEAEEGRTRTRYTLYTQGAHLHRVQWKEESDWEGQRIHKTHFVYDCFGNCVEENHFGSDGNLAYTIKKTYDCKGNLLEETNPLDQVASYQYDSRGRCIHEIPFSGKLCIDRTFDAKGRQVLLKKGDHITRFAYNASDDLVEKIDPLGLRTTYTYHPVHHKPTLIESPPTLTRFTYDSFGREIERSDAYGGKYKTRYNSYGNPIEIVNPDGGKETNLYASNGLLVLQTDPDAKQSTFTYDVLGRVLSKTIGSHTTTYSYDAYQLIEEIDPQGNATKYRYDLQGRKVEEERAGRTTKFRYDTLGFLAAEERSGGFITYTRDPVGRMLEKSEDGLFNTRWSYDPSGLIATITQEGTTTFSYDPYDRLIRKVDAEGAQTTICYEEGDQILVKRIRDPRGVDTTEVYNAHGLLLKREISGHALEEFEYDKALRLVRQDHLTFSYTPGGLRSSMTEGNTRTTFWSYTPGGKIQTKTKPDGTQLTYQYTPEGTLAKVEGREFQYDALDRLVQGTGFSRTLDPFGNILKEEFSNGLWIESRYDDRDRPLERTLPNGSRIAYEYEGPYLKRVTRLSPNGSKLYSHTYDQYNQAGLPLSETGCFQTTYTYDRTGVRKISQVNPSSQEDLVYDPAGNLIRRGSVSYTYDDASQLTSETEKFTARYDTHYHCVEKNGCPLTIDELGQEQGVSHDKNGNITRPGFVFDAFDQLIQAEGENLLYDALGRRLQKGNTSYLYIGEAEIGAFEGPQAKELKILGRQEPIAIEIEGHPYAPIHDVQGTIRSLIDWETGEIAHKNDCDAFGVGLTDAIPYAYAGKRYDAKTGLIYFGQRYYDPALAQWLTPDPLGPEDHSNLYQYVFNNPFYYFDPDGQEAATITLALWGASQTGGLSLAALTGPVGWIIGGTVILTTIIAWKGPEIFHKVNNWMDYKAAQSFNFAIHQVIQNLGGVSQYAAKQLVMKKKQIDAQLPDNPDDLLNDLDWEETSHPNAKEKGHRTFENKRTGEKIRHDEAKPGTTGHKAQDHWHRFNPDSTGDIDKYLDAQGNPVSDGHPDSHLYPK